MWKAKSMGGSPGFYTDLRSMFPDDATASDDSPWMVMPLDVGIDHVMMHLSFRHRARPRLRRSNNWQPGTNSCSLTRSPTWPTFRRRDGTKVRLARSTAGAGPHTGAQFTRRATKSMIHIRKGHLAPHASGHLADRKTGYRRSKDRASPRRHRAAYRREDTALRPQIPRTARRRSGAALTSRLATRRPRAQFVTGRSSSTPPVGRPLPLATDRLAHSGP